MMIIDMMTLDLIECCRPIGGPSLTDNEAEATSRVFQALGDPARLKIVNLLARSERSICACEFVPVLGLAQATVSHHLKKLTDVGLLEREQRGKWAYFSLDGDALARLTELVEIKEGVS
jgi:ArsR family transcriptional regulator, arsenate/arsenite/antimonite-responsive transcriptional repressor